MQSVRPSEPASPVRLSAAVLATEEDRHFQYLAWGCSICALFLAAGILGLTARERTRAKASPTPPRVVVPVVFEPASAPDRTQRTAPARNAAGGVPAKASPASPASVAEVALPDARVNPMRPDDILRPAPARPVAPLAGPQPPAASASRYEPAANAPNTPRPSYPPLALRRGYEGTVVIEFTVAPSGRITAARVGSSSGHGVLDDAALEAVQRRWHFPPGEERHHFVEIVFQLK